MELMDLVRTAIPVISLISVLVLMFCLKQEQKLHKRTRDLLVHELEAHVATKRRERAFRDQVRFLERNIIGDVPDYDDVLDEPEPVFPTTKPVQIGRVKRTLEM